MNAMSCPIAQHYCYTLIVECAEKSFKQLAARELGVNAKRLCVMQPEGADDVAKEGQQTILYSALQTISNEGLPHLETGAKSAEGNRDLGLYTRK